MQGNLSVRQVEELVRNEKNGEGGIASKGVSNYFDFSNYISTKNQLAKKLQTDIRFKSRSNDNGTIIISFSSREQLEDILKKMV